MVALFEGRTAFVEAANRIFPGDELAELQSYMERVLPLTDDGRFPALVEAGRRVLAFAQRNEPALVAVAAIQERDGYRPRAVCLGALREVLTYPELSEVLGAALRFGGDEGVGHEPLLAVSRAASYELRDVKQADDPSRVPPMHPSDPNRTSALLADFFLRERDWTGTGQPRFVVRRDWRGVARAKAGAQGGVAAPFSDADGDGLADTDAKGALTTATGALAPTPFHLDPRRPDPAAGRDAHGRALDAAGAPLFEYLDLDRSLLATLLRQGAQLVSAPGDLLALVEAAGLMAGPRTSVVLTAKDGSLHPAAILDVTRSPLLDLAHATFAVLGDANLPALTEGVRALLGNEGAIAGFVRGLDSARQTLRAHPERERVAESNFFDELLLVLREIARFPGLLEDLIAAIRDPRTKNLGKMMANYLHYRDVHVLDLASGQVRNELGGAFFSRPVDRNAPDSGTNRSIQQRIWHMINDANGMRICNKEGARIDIPVICDIPGVASLLGCSTTYRACELFEIQNGAVFYAQAMAGKAHLRLKTENMPSVVAAAVESVGPDLLLEMMTGVDGMTSHPTPQAINRYLFMDELPLLLRSVQDLPADKDGDLIYTTHRGTLFSWEVVHPGTSCRDDDPCTFLEAFRPLAEAFAKHDAERVMIDMLSVLHRHWPSRKSSDHQYSNPQQREFANGTGIAYLEPTLVDLLENTRLWEAGRALVVASGAIRLARGASLDTLIARSFRYLVDPALTPNLRYRDGRASGTFADGVTPIPDGVAPANLLIDALRAGSRLVPDDAQSKAARESGVDGIFWALLGTEADPTAAGGLRMRDRQVLPTLRAMLEFAQRRLEAHDPSCQANTDCGGGGVCVADSGRCTTHHALSDRERWLQLELPYLAGRVAASPLLPAGTDLVTALRKDEVAREAMRRMVSYLLDERVSPQTFPAVLTAVADALQLMQDDRHMVPILNLLGRVLGSDVGLVESSLRFMAPAVATDSGGVFARLLGNAVQEQDPARSHLEVLFELAKQVNRADPLATGVYEVPDVQAALGALERFLGDPDRGVVKFFELIRNRCGGPCG